MSNETESWYCTGCGKLFKDKTGQSPERGMECNLCSGGVYLPGSDVIPVVAGMRAADERMRALKYIAYEYTINSRDHGGIGNDGLVNVMTLILGLDHTKEMSKWLVYALLDEFGNMDGG